MAKSATSVLAYGLASGIYAGQQLAKALGVSSKIVDPKNPPGPGPDGAPPTTFNGRRYKQTRGLVQKFGDPAAVAFIAGEEYLSRTADLVTGIFSRHADQPAFRPGLLRSLSEQGSLTLAALGPKTRPLSSAGRKHALHLRPRAQ